LEGQIRSTGVKLLLPGLRRLLYVASLLTFIAGIQLYVLTGHTDRYFAWTIAVPLSAAFLGGNYFASFLLALLSARETIWVKMRVAVPSVFVFTNLLLIATLLHRNKFHWDSFFGWAWLAVYALVPPVMLVLLIRQGLAPGVNPPRTAPLPFWLRIFLFLEGLLMLAFGTWLFLDPAGASSYWPWKLTPLTARAAGSWLWGIGLAAFQTPLENDWSRVKPAIVTYTAVGFLQGIALIRYPGNFAWGTPSGILYLFLVAATCGLGVYSCSQMRRH
jgi:hypothetical protein